MRFLLEPPDLATLDGAIAAARSAAAAGLDGILLAPTAELPAPLVVAAAVGPTAPGLLIAAEVLVGDRHPVELAEEAAVVDHACCGRLVLVATPAPDARDALPEALDVLRAAWAPRPFAHDAARWTVPARLPGHGAPQRARVTPAPLQPRLELWSTHAEGAMSRGLGHVADADADPVRLGDAWAHAEERHGAALVGAPRARREAWAGPGALLERLREGRRAFGQDWAVVSASARDAAPIGSEVRPRIQLDELPPGLEEHWSGREVAR